MFQNHHSDSYEFDCKHFLKSTFVNNWFFRRYNNILINFEILFSFKNIEAFRQFRDHAFLQKKHKCSDIRSSNFIFTVLFKYRKQRLIVDVSFIFKSKSVWSLKQISIKSWISNSSLQQWTTTKSFSQSLCWFSFRTIFISKSKNLKI